MNRDEARALIERQFEEGPLSTEDRARLFAAIREDPELKSLYDRYAEIEAGLEDGGLAGMKARLQADAQATLAASASAATTASEPAPGSKATTAAQPTPVTEPTPISDPAPASQPTPAQTEPAPAPIIDLAARRAARRRWIGVGLTAAAAVALFGLIGRGPGPELPGYEFHLSAGAQELRGPEQETLRFEPSTRFSIVLRPERAVEGRLEARAALLSAERSHPAAGAWSSSDGAFKLEGRTDALFDALPGEYELVVVIGPLGSLPSDLRAARTSDTVRVWRQTVNLSPAR